MHLWCFISCLLPPLPTGRFYSLSFPHFLPIDDSREHTHDWKGVWAGGGPVVVRKLGTGRSGRSLICFREELVNGGRDRANEYDEKALK